MSCQQEIWNHLQRRTLDIQRLWWLNQSEQIDLDVGLGSSELHRIKAKCLLGVVKMNSQVEAKTANALQLEGVSLSLSSELVDVLSLSLYAHLDWAEEMLATLKRNIGKELEPGALDSNHQHRDLLERLISQYQHCIDTLRVGFRNYDQAMALLNDFSNIEIGSGGKEFRKRGLTVKNLTDLRRRFGPTFEKTRQQINNLRSKVHDLRRAAFTPKANRSTQLSVKQPQANL